MCLDHVANYLSFLVHFIQSSEGLSCLITHWSHENPWLFQKVVFSISKLLLSETCDEMFIVVNWYATMSVFTASMQYSTGTAISLLVQTLFCCELYLKFCWHYHSYSNLHLMHFFPFRGVFDKCSKSGYHSIYQSVLWKFYICIDIYYIYIFVQKVFLTDIKHGNLLH